MSPSPKRIINVDYACSIAFARAKGGKRTNHSFAPVISLSLQVTTELPAGAHKLGLCSTDCVYETKRWNISYALSVSK